MNAIKPVCVARGSIYRLERDGRFVVGRGHPALQLERAGDALPAVPQGEVRAGDNRLRPEALKGARAPHVPREPRHIVVR